jgi:hypothetical protein
MREVERIKMYFSLEDFLMMSAGSSKKIEELIKGELSQAHEARLKGNEGRARVCARRAAGWAVESIYAGEEAVKVPEANAYRFLQWFTEQSNVPVQLREAASRLTTRVGRDFTLPFEQDPLCDAEMIVDWILDSDIDNGKSFG